MLWDSAKLITVRYRIASAFSQHNCSGIWALICWTESSGPRLCFLSKNRTEQNTRWSVARPTPLSCLNIAQAILKRSALYNVRFWTVVLCLTTSISNMKLSSYLRNSMFDLELNAIKLTFDRFREVLDTSFCIKISCFANFSIMITAFLS